jgi:hypothetical protein
MWSQLVGRNEWCYYDIQSEERQKICQQQLRLGNCISRRWEGEKVRMALVDGKETYREGRA